MPDRSIEEIAFTVADRILASEPVQNLLETESALSPLVKPMHTEDLLKGACFRGFFALSLSAGPDCAKDVGMLPNCGKARSWKTSRSQNGIFGVARQGMVSRATLCRLMVDASTGRAL